MKKDVRGSSMAFNDYWKQKIASELRIPNTTLLREKDQFSSRELLPQSKVP
jgi:hypothetical protein